MAWRYATLVSILCLFESVPIFQCNLPTRTSDILGMKLRLDGDSIRRDSEVRVEWVLVSGPCWLTGGFSPISADCQDFSLRICIYIRSIISTTQNTRALSWYLSTNFWMSWGRSVKCGVRSAAEWSIEYTLSNVKWIDWIGPAILAVRRDLWMWGMRAVIFVAIIMSEGL